MFHGVLVDIISLLLLSSAVLSCLGDAHVRFVCICVCQSSWFLKPSRESRFCLKGLVSPSEHLQDWILWCRWNMCFYLRSVFRFVSFVPDDVQLVLHEDGLVQLVALEYFEQLSVHLLLEIVVSLVRLEHFIDRVRFSAPADSHALLEYVPSLRLSFARVLLRVGISCDSLLLGFSGSDCNWISYLAVELFQDLFLLFLS